MKSFSDYENLMKTKNISNVRNLFCMVAIFILWTPFAFPKKNESSPNVNVIPNVTYNVPTMKYGPKLSYRKVTNTVMNLFFYLFVFSTRFHIFHDMYAYTFLHFCCIQWIFLYLIIIIGSISMFNREPVTFYKFFCHSILRQMSHAY